MNPITKKFIGDLAVAGIAIALATAYLLSTYSIRSVEIVDPLGPKAFPALLGIALLLCGVSLAAKTLIGHYRPREAASDTLGAESNGGHPLAVLAVGAWLLAYYFVFEPLGFLLSTMVLIFGLTAYFNRGHWITNTAVAILFPIVIDLIFSHVLGRAPAPGILSF